jgi:hypothetical protein
MDAVMLLEQLDDHGRVLQRQRMAGTGSQCRIGRSVVCDLVIEDGYAAPEHTLLTLQPDGRVEVQDLGSLNGTRINDRRLASGSSEIVADAQLIVGRTRLALRTAHSPLPPERVFRRDLLRRHRTALAAAGLVGCVVAAAFSQWLNAPERLLTSVLTASLITVGALALWVGLWSLITHLNHGGWQVRIHAAIVACCATGLAWGYWLYRIGAFATQWRWLPGAVALLAIGVLFAMLYLHLRNATHMIARHAAIAAAVATAALGSALWLVDLAIDVRNVNRMAHGPAIFPPSLRAAPSIDVADYLSDVTALKRAANRNRQESLVDTPLVDEGE